MFTAIDIASMVIFAVVGMVDIVALVEAPCQVRVADTEGTLNIAEDTEDTAGKR
jgi:hypothetical protein